MSKRRAPDETDAPPGLSSKRPCIAAASTIEHGGPQGPSTFHQTRTASQQTSQGGDGIAVYLAFKKTIHRRTSNLEVLGVFSSVQAANQAIKDAFLEGPWGRKKTKRLS